MLEQIVKSGLCKYFSITTGTKCSDLNSSTRSVGYSIYKTISELDVPPKQDPTAIIDTKLSVILSMRKNVGIMLGKAASITGEQFARRHII